MIFEEEKNRIARFFLAQHLKIGKYLPDNHKIYKVTKNAPNGPKNAKGQ
jgi:hypothetical protein